MSGKNTAEKAGHGSVVKTLDTPRQHEDAVPAKKCVGPGCDTMTSTPHAKLSNGDFLCSSECHRAHYAKPNDLGVWGTAPILHSVT